MLLTTLSKYINESLNSSPESSWGDGYKVGSELLSRWALDPFRKYEGPSLNLFVVPHVIEYNFGNSSQLRPTRSQPSRSYTYNSTKIVSVILMVKLSVVDETGIDVTTEAFGTKVLDTREYIEKYVIGLNIPKINLTSVDTVPPDEYKLDESWFMTITQFGYEMQECSSVS